MKQRDTITPWLKRCGIALGVWIALQIAGAQFSQMQVANEEQILTQIQPVAQHTLLVPTITPVRTPPHHTTKKSAHPIGQAQHRLYVVRHISTQHEQRFAPQRLPQHPASASPVPTATPDYFVKTP